MFGDDAARLYSCSRTGERSGDKGRISINRNVIEVVVEDGTLPPGQALRVGETTCTTSAASGPGA